MTISKFPFKFYYCTKTTGSKHSHRQNRLPRVVDGSLVGSRIFLLANCASISCLSLL